VSLDFNDLSSAGSAFQTAGPEKENTRNTALCTKVHRAVKISGAATGRETIK